MRKPTIFSTTTTAAAAAALFGLAAGQSSAGTGTSVNTATIADATASPQVANGTLAAVSATSGYTPITQTGTDPIVPSTVTQATTANAPSIATTSLTTNLVKPTVVANAIANDLFASIATDNPAAVLGRTTTEQFQPPLNVASQYGGTSGSPIQTNNFYTNLLVGGQTSQIYPMPYVLNLDKSNGLCVSNNAASDYVYGGSFNGDPSYYFAPVGRCPVGFGATEFTSNAPALQNSNIQSQSLDVTLTSGSGSAVITLVHGNALLTMRYNNLTPRLFSGTAAFTLLTPVSFKAPVGVSSGVTKWRLNINNGDTWLVYAISSSSTPLSLTLATNGAQLAGNAPWTGALQVAKLPAGFTNADEATYDSSVGTYPTGAIVSGQGSGKVATYSFSYSPVQLLGLPLLTFVYPHLQESVSAGVPTSLKLWSNTKGLMRAYQGNTLSFSENNLPTDINWLPWSPLGNLQNYSASALQLIAKAANAELQQNMAAQTNMDSMYFSGKALAKFAQICLVVNDVLGSDATSCLSSLKSAFAPFIGSSNINPVAYDTVWKGVMSSCGDAGGTAQRDCDFGNAVYNDHHFHYGYHVYTAAVIAHIDPTWLQQGKNKAWVNTLIRDYANPSTSDPYLPFSRSFDWFAGHSWAHGITESADGKDEESSSEDYNSIYAIKLWGKVIGDPSMEARANLQLSIMRRAMNDYMLLGPDNTVMPPAMINNYVAGITFENKIDHTTYFGSNLEYIQGIHMIPLTPVSAFIRQPKFVAQEWSALLGALAPTLTSGWKGILYANLAISNATAAYQTFSDPNYSSSWLDGGASLTWYLTYAAGLGGAGNFQLAVTASGTVPVTATVTGITSQLPVSLTSTISLSTTVSGSPVILPASSSVSVSAIFPSSVSTSGTLPSSASSMDSIVSTTSTVPSSSASVMMNTSTSASSSTSTSAGTSSVSTSSASASSASTGSSAFSVPAATSTTVVATTSTTVLPPTTITAGGGTLTIGGSTLTTVTQSSSTQTVVGSGAGSSVASGTNAGASSGSSNSGTDTSTESSGSNGSSSSSGLPGSSASTGSAGSSGSSGSSDSTGSSSGSTISSGSTSGSQSSSGSPPGDSVSNNQGSSSSGSTGSSGNSGTGAVSGSAPPNSSGGSTESAGATGSSGSTGSTAGGPGAGLPVTTAPSETTTVGVVAASSGAALAPGASDMTPGQVGSATGSGRIYTTSGTCAGTKFTEGWYVCWDDSQLCPIQAGTIYYNCAGACYDPAKYACPSGQILVGVASSIPKPVSAPSLQSCGAAQYDPASYTCYGNKLCPIQGNVVSKLCGNDCYNPALYHCDTVTGKLAQGAEAGATPVSGGLGLCGTTTYDKSSYTCYSDAQLCPIINGVVTQACGQACYDPALYSCSAAGVLAGR
ncbi:endo-1,3-beta glucanase [Savitreella phatthalungensis]